MDKMGKIRIGVVVVLLQVIAVCLGDKDPTLSLRPPSASSPVFSSSIDSIPVLSSASSQQSVYSKRPNSLHSTVAASASSSSSSDQSTSGGRNNSPWYTPGNTFTFDFPGGSGSDLAAAGASSHSTSSSSNGGPYYEQQPPAQAAPSSTSDSYGPPQTGSQAPAYTYFYQHYPSSSGTNHGWSGGGGSGVGGEDSGHGGLFGDIGIPGIPGLGGAGGGLAGIGGIKILKAIAKGVLFVKPFLILGLLLLIALPVLFLLLPIPIITITSQPSMLRAARSSKIGTYLTELSGKVLNSEECLERIICKLPHAPEKYQSRVKLVWDEYGSKMVANERVSRGLNAYFETSSQKNKSLKCNQRFKCSNKYL